MFPRQLFQSSLPVWRFACLRMHCLAPGRLALLAPTGQQVWPRQKAGLQGGGGPALEAILAGMGTDRAPTRSTCPRCPVPLGNWRLRCSLGLVVPAGLRPCPARLCRLGCPDGRAGPKGGCGEAKWGSDLASRPWAGVQLIGLARLAHRGVEASAPVGQRQTPLCWWGGQSTITLALRTPGAQRYWKVLGRAGPPTSWPQMLP